LLSGSYIAMRGAQAIITSVASWYEKNGRRPVESKNSQNEERRLARKWRDMLKSNLDFHIRKEAEDLEARMGQKVDEQCQRVDRVVTWVEGHKRRPRRDRYGEEGKVAMLWGRLWTDISLLPPK